MDSRSATSTVSGHKANEPHQASLTSSRAEAPLAALRQPRRPLCAGAAIAHATLGRRAHTPQLRQGGPHDTCVRTRRRRPAGASAASQSAASPAAARPAGDATREWEVGDRRSPACVSRGERRHGERRGLQRFGVMISPRRRAARKLGAEPRLGSTRERPARPRWRVDLGTRPPRGPAYLRSYATDQQKDGSPAAPPTPSRRRF